jgi:hypothetical protein
MMFAPITVPPRFIFERRSGVAGFRCLQCGLWIEMNQYPENQSWKCLCEDKEPKNENA